MYVVNVMYPKPKNSARDFNFDHYAKVHMPLGIGLLHRHFGVLPARIEIIGATYGADRTHASADYNCVGVLYFDKKEDADRFIDLFNMERPTALLMADWPKYTPANPVALLGEVTVCDPAAILLQSAAVIAAAQRELDGPKS